ncbi:MAG: hypothetical protein JWN03_7354 [Nocardia sp.]|nr:hypothetical protein [Nocardia sp.]MCU1647079.1 hypothetical protein [Nocardia sp.]
MKVTRPAMRTTTPPPTGGGTIDIAGILATVLKFLSSGSTASYTPH